VLRGAGQRVAAAAAIVLAAGAAGVAAAAGGDPGRGALLWQSNGCGACHAFKAAGSSGTSAPNIDRWLAPHALRARMSAERFAHSRVYWGGRGMPAYGPGLAAGEIDDLVSFVLGRPFTAPAEAVPRAPSFDPPPSLVTAGPGTVAAWVRAKGLTSAVAKSGAALFARVGCLSCHSYLGSGRRRLGANDLSRIGRSARTLRGYERYLARPYVFGNTAMPSYADLTARQLAQLAAFLEASR
jgi:cytochrome c2